MTEIDNIPLLDAGPSAAAGADPAGRRTGWWFVLIFVLLAAGTLAGGAFYYRNFERHFRAAAENELSAIADLKVAELAQWRRERLADGAVFFCNVPFAGEVRRFLAAPADAEARLHVQEWIDKFQAHHGYDQIRLLNVQGATCLSMPAELPPLSSVLSNAIPEVLRSGQMAFQDFYRSDQNGRIYLGLLVPILAGPDAGRPLGVLFMRIDPSIYLYPFIQRWPTPSASAETLLVRREGDDSVFLNELRFRKNAALDLRFSLENTDLPAAKAVRGQEGIVAGRDYRGVPVIAAVRAVPDSPWFLVARRDVAEVYAPLKARRGQVVAGIVFLLFGAGAGVGLVWRQQRIRFYRAQAEVALALARNAKELQDKNAELERFLYTVSHDLKSPVVTVRTFLGYLEQDVAAADAGRIGKDMRFMRDATDKMEQLLDAVLEMSRVGRVAGPPVPVAFRTLVDEALAAVAGPIAERGVQTKVADRDVPLLGDRLRLAEIWQNLVENAVKFMGDQPAPRIEIGAEPRGAETVFFVRDNGIGIDPRFQAKIFGLFEKLDAKAEGTGMGLAIVQRIVMVLYGGRIWVESAGPGHGSCFHFTLPEAMERSQNPESRIQKLEDGKQEPEK